MKLIHVLGFMVVLSANGMAQRAGTPIMTGAPLTDDPLTYLVRGGPDQYYAWSSRERQIKIFSSSGAVIGTSGKLLVGGGLGGLLHDPSDAGGLWVFGAFSYVDPSGNLRLGSVIKLTSDLHLDTVFDVPVALWTKGHTAHIEVIALAPDGNGGAFFGGTFDFVNGVPMRDLAHVDARGRVRAVNAPTGGVVALVATETGVVLANQWGIFTLSGQEAEPKPFAEQPLEVAVNTIAYDRRYGLAAEVRYDGEPTICVFDDSGRRKNAFSSRLRRDLPIHSLAWDHQGRLLVCGIRPTDTWTQPGFCVMRLLPDGDIDPSWSRAVQFDLPPSYARVLDDGSIWIYGDFQRVNGISAPWVVRLLGETSSTNHARSVNHSARGVTDGPDMPLIVGFVLHGDVWREVLIRAVGPSLVDFGVPNVPDTTSVKLYRGSELLESFAGKFHLQVPEKGRLEAAAARLGAFPFTTAHGEEAQILTCLPPGVYSVVVNAQEREQVQVLGEVYHE